MDAATTSTSFVFDVTFTALQQAIQFKTSPVLPGTLTYTSATTIQWQNADLLAYFNVLGGSSATPIVGLGGTSASSVLYSNLFTWLGSILGNPAAEDNFTVQTSIAKVLFEAEYDPPAGTPAATQNQLGRLRAILDSIAGLLTGDSNGIMTSQWDTNSTDSQNSTYSDNIVSSQRDGQNQSYYLVIPYACNRAHSSFSLRLAPSSPAQTTCAAAGTTVTTGIINMPSTQAAVPGGPINDLVTMGDFSAAISNAGTLGATPRAGLAGFRERPRGLRGGKPV